MVVRVSSRVPSTH
uniref:Uncharacterized protein n=1 Tax=Arundo donax TaxID=35708 RepID=A0A0A9F3G8_ARUDO